MAENTPAPIIEPRPITTASGAVSRRASEGVAAITSLSLCRGCAAYDAAVIEGETSDAEARSLASHVLLVRGVIVIGLGFVALVWPSATVKVVAVLIGILVVAFGAATIGHALDRRHLHQPWIFGLLGGLIAVGFGIAAIFWPGPTVLVVARLFGLLLLISGFLGVLDVFAAGGDDPSRIPTAIVSVIGVLAGAALWLWPDITIGVVVVIQGLFWVIHGTISVIASREVRRAAVA
jgi:uncharacterized membrane protein HdeD (DUF308 family)